MSHVRKRCQSKSFSFGILFSLILFCVNAPDELAAQAGQVQEPAHEWVPLFDGETLDGWVQRGGKAKYSIRDGAIVGQTIPKTPNSFLCTEKAYADFQLELEFRVDSDLNSGVQFRSNSFSEYKNGRVHGYQCEIDPSWRGWTAGIYDEGRRGWIGDLSQNRKARYAFKPGVWNQFRIEAIGDRLRTWINGVPAADISDSKTDIGFVALQVHGVGARKDPLTVEWRKIRIRETNVRWPEPAKKELETQGSPFKKDATLQKVSTGFGSASGLTAGPDGRVYLNDSETAKTHVYDPKSGATELLLSDNGAANGLLWAPGDNLIFCAQGDRKLSVRTGTQSKVLSQRWANKKLNGPQDLALDGIGGVYFTDPIPLSQKSSNLDFGGIFYQARNQKIKLVNRELKRPAGLALSADHKLLYIGDTEQNKTWVFGIKEAGQLGEKRSFCEIAGAISVDLVGNVYIAVDDSIVAFDSAGTEIARLAIPEKPKRCLIVGQKMYITTSENLYCVETNTIGCR